MRASITITTETGAVYTGEVDLSVAEQARKPSKAGGGQKLPERGVDAIDFGLPVRAFVKRYSNGMSGAKRLALLVARIAEGDLAAQVQRSQVRKLWGRMTSPMGGAFNPAYETRARENGWIDSPKAGLYALLSGWKEIFSR